jgi:hypothetical protein
MKDETLCEKRVDYTVSRFVFEQSLAKCICEAINNTFGQACAIGRREFSYRPALDGTTAPVEIQMPFFQQCASGIGFSRVEPGSNTHLPDGTEQTTGENCSALHFATAFRSLAFSSHPGLELRFWASAVFMFNLLGTES